MKFKFIGKDGSMGLKKGTVYEIKTFIRHNLLWATWNDNSCPYKNVETFLVNWERSDA